MGATDVHNSSGMGVAAVVATTNGGNNAAAPGNSRSDVRDGSGSRMATSLHMVPTGEIGHSQKATLTTQRRGPNRR